MEKQGQIIADFFAHGYRVSGNFSARQRSLGDAIYDVTTSYLTVTEAYFSVVTNPADIASNYPSATIVKKNLSFAITSNTEDSLRRDQRYGSYLKLKPTGVFITLPSFEIRGYLRIPGRIDVLMLLGTQTEDFLTLIDPVARCSYKPEISYQGGAAIINKRHISFLGLE